MQKSSVIINTFLKILKILPFLVVVIVGVPIVGMAIQEGGKLIGLRPVPVPVVGTGSMYPSLFWSVEEGGPENSEQKVIEEYRTTPHLFKRFAGVRLGGNIYLRSQIGYGDMVAFKNARTREILQKEGKDQEAGFIKRIIGVPGDALELRDGFVYLNGELLSEPYIHTPRSTYGGSSLSDCVKLNLGTGEYFVLGDNRKVSSDSRFELGVIAESDIEYFLPLKSQTIYHSLWRDTKKDEELLGQPTLSTSEFISLVNEKRKNKKLPLLKQVPALASSASLRGNKLLDNKNTPFNLEASIKSVGYSNIIVGEFVSYGHFTAKELLDSLLFRGDAATQVMGKDYTEFGLTTVNKDVAGCPSQVIVGHLGGYVPATYSKETLESWKSLVSNLDKVIPSWVKAQEYNGLDQNKLKQLIEILYRRRNLGSDVVSIMEKQEWLSKSMEDRIAKDTEDAKIAESLAGQLNKE